MIKKIHEIIQNFTRSKKIFLGLLFILFLGSNKIVAQSDGCSGASALTVGSSCSSTPFTMTSFTNDGPVLSGCVGTTNYDGWYTFTTDATTTTISIDGTSNRRLGLALYTAGSCPSPTEVTCTVPNAANASLTSVSVTPSTTYLLRLMRTNTGTNSFTGTICVYKAAPSYCTPTNTYSTSYYISGVTTAGGVANISNTPTGFSGYTDYSAQFVSQLAGSSFSLNATHPSSTYGYSVWVDWNNDGDFADAGENVISTGYLNTPASLGNVTIPMGQAPGNYRMRIRNAYLSNPAPACGSFDYGEAEDYSIQVIAAPACSGTPTAGTTTVSPVSGNPGSSYIVSATGFSNASGLTFQWQYSTNGGTTWTNQGAATGTYSNYTATAPALGITTLWHLIVTCTNSGQSATSTNGTFTSVSTLNVPTTGNNTVTCGTNVVLYDNGGSAGNYANSSNGYTVLEAGIGATINISGSYITESVDYIRFYNGVGTGGTLLATFSGSSGGTINYTGTVGQTITVQFTSDGSVVYSGFSLSVTYSGVCFPACSGTPTGGTVVTNPVSGSPGSSYTVSATGYTGATGLTFQWQYSTNGGTTWTNQGAATGTYSNYIATAPALGITTLWHLIVTCTSSGQSATSTNGTFTSVSTLNVPTTGNNTVTCGTNVVLYDNGGSAGNYANSSNGYTVLEAGIGATINISGSYVTESVDYIRFYSGVGTGGALLATYSGSSGGTINYTGTAGQTITVQFTSDGSVVYSGFSLSVTYSGVCFPACSGTPTGGTVATNPNTGWPGSSYVVSATGYTQALNMTYQWQSSIDAGVTWTNAGAVTSSYVDYNTTAPASGDVHWQLIVTCTNSAQSATSSTGVFVTMTISVVVTGCPNVVSGGLGLSGADPAVITCVSPSGCVDLEATYLDLGETTSYIVEPIAYNPPFSFSGLANPVSVNTDDVWSPVVNLPFDFCFYGNTYTQCVIGSNGILSFNTGLAGTSAGYSFASNIPISGDLRLKENSIFGVFHDINPGVGGEVGWELITLATGCRALVASWSDVPMFDENSILYTGMMVLYENSNIIEVYIQEKNIDNFGAGTWNGGNAVVGIQNSTGTLASVPPGRNGLDTNWASTNEAWRFVPNGTSIATIQWHEGSGVSGPVIGTTDVINVCPANTTIYTAEITYTLCDGSTITELDETTVTVNKDKTWDGSTSTDWNTANNWTPAGVPLITESVYIPNVANDPIIGAGADALACSLNIEVGAVLTINSGRNMVVTNAVTVAAGGVFNVMDSANLVQVNDASINTGNIIMNRTANIRLQDYVYWSSPVANFDSSIISPLTPTSLIWKWEPTVSANTNGFGTWINGSETMLNGKGYIVRGPSNYTNTLQNYTAIFNGVANNGIISTPILRGTYDGLDYIGPTLTIVTKDDDNWNLIGNPYPSAINAIDFLTLNSNIDGFVKIWTHGTLPISLIDPFYANYTYNYTLSDYITYNSTGSSSGPGTFGGHMAAGQGFFVSMLHSSTSDSETVSFNNTMRSSLYNNSQFFKNSNAEIERNRIWLDLLGTDNSNVRALIGYIENATNDRDRLYDAVSNSKINFNLYSQIEQESFLIQGRSLPFNSDDRVALGLKTPVSGEYKFSIAAVDGLFETTNQNIYIEDLENNIIHDIRLAPYIFNIAEGVHNERFVLRFTDNRLSNEELVDIENDIMIISNSNLEIKSTNDLIKSITIHDVIGRLIFQKNNINSNKIILSSIQKNNTTLLVKVELENGTIINKKVIF